MVVDRTDDPEAGSHGSAAQERPPASSTCWRRGVSGVIYMAVFHHFRRCNYLCAWSSGVLDRMLDRLRWRSADPTAAIFDSQSVKTTQGGAMTRPRGSRVASATWRWTPKDRRLFFGSTGPMSRTVTVRRMSLWSSCARRRRFPGCLPTVAMRGRDCAMRWLTWAFGS